MSASDDRELYHETDLATLCSDDVALRTFWVTLAAGIVGLAIISAVTPHNEPTEHRVTRLIQIASPGPVDDLISHAEFTAPGSGVSGAPTLPPTFAAPDTPLTVETLPIEPVPVVTPPAAPTEVAETIQNQPKPRPEPVALPEETAPAPLVAGTVVDAPLTPEPDVVSLPFATVAAQPATVSEAAPDNDVRAGPVVGVEPVLTATKDQVVQFHARRYTLTCPHCGGRQSESADCIADHRSFRCLSCAAKIKVRELHERLADEQKQMRRLARR